MGGATNIIYNENIKDNKIIQNIQKRIDNNDDNSSNVVKFKNMDGTNWGIPIDSSKQLKNMNDNDLFMMSNNSQYTSLDEAFGSII